MRGTLNAEVDDVDRIEESDVVKRKRTKPKYHTEGSLLTAMENAGNKIDDEELREAMKENGLGTPATRASIIETLKKREYISTKGKSLISTEKGRALVKLVDERLASAALTG